LAIEALEERCLLTGTWTALAGPAPDSLATMLLLTDGTVMAHASQEQHERATWYQLTPDASGSYVNGTWSQLASDSNTRVYYPSNVLQDGRVFVAGGEYGNGQNTGNVYDPTTDTWTRTPNGPLGDIGDVPSEVLPDNRVIVGSRQGSRTQIYDPSSNTWTVGPTKADTSSEETWMLLPDQTILDAEVFNAPNAEKYIPSENRWISAGRIPVNLTQGFEIGAGLLLPDGRAFFLGASGKTALYTPPDDPHAPGAWAAGPDIPNNLGTWDAPAAMMPNGKVLCACGPRNYNGPTTFFEFDPVANTFTLVPGSPNITNPPWETRMLMLPNGQVLFSLSRTQLYVYTPDGAPDPSWQPTISTVMDNGDGSFLLTGTQLNGISEGAGYGDDAEMSTNYPLVQMIGSDGTVYYARTSYWSNIGVATGSTPVSTYFVPPAGLPADTYTLYVIANGIASDPFSFPFGGSGPSARQQPEANRTLAGGADGVRTLRLEITSLTHSPASAEVTSAVPLPFEATAGTADLSGAMAAEYSSSYSVEMAVADVLDGWFAAEKSSLLPGLDLVMPTM
jgi:hypothetical protein